MSHKNGDAAGYATALVPGAPSFVNPVCGKRKQVGVEQLPLYCLTLNLMAHQVLVRALGHKLLTKLWPLARVTTTDEVAFLHLGNIAPFYISNLKKTMGLFKHALRLGWRLITVRLLLAKAITIGVAALSAEVCQSGSWRKSSAGGSTVVEPTCFYQPGWNCTPPSCPVGWTDSGVTSSDVTAAYSGVSFYRVYRHCNSSIALTLIEPSCSYPSGWSCIPPACPTGWTDLTILSQYVSAAYSGVNFYKYYRHCIQ